MLRWHWAHPTTPAGVGWDLVIEAKVRLGTERGISARAALGEADTITLVVDDPTGTADYKTLHRIYAVETDTPGSQLVWNGYINDARISRSAEGVLYPTGAGRVWELEVVQENTILGFRIVTGTDGKRPAETAAARLTWLLASPYCSTVHDHGLIDWTGLADFTMDAVDVRGQTAADVLRDISLVSGYNHYCRYNDDFAEIELACYEPNTSALDASSVKISNDPADLDAGGDFDAGLVYAPGEDAVLTRQGSRVAAGIYLPYDGGSTYGYDLTTSYEFGFRDMPAPSANVKTLAKAEALRDRLLAQHSSMDERVTCRIQTSAANLNAVKHGQSIQAKFTHFPGWTSYRSARVVSKAFSRPENLTQARYDLDLELSPQTGCYGATSSGTYWPLGGSGNTPNPSTTGNVLYLRPGISYPVEVTPGFQGIWHFPAYGAGGEGTIDYAGDCVQNTLRLVVVGAGTMTVKTAQYTQPRTLTVGLYHWDYGSGTAVLDSTQTIAAGDTATVVISTHAQANCTHFVDVRDTAAVCGDKWGFRGMTWARNYSE